MADGFSDNERTFDLVRGVIQQYLRERAGDDLKGIRVTDTQKRPYSTVTFLTADTDQGTRRFVVKQAVRHPLNAHIFELQRDQASVEFSLLTNLHPRFAKVERCSVPRPVGVLPVVDALILEHVDGTVLSERVRYLHHWSRRARFGELAADVRESGRWLRHFQEFTGPRIAGVGALRDILRHCRDRLRLIEESQDRRYPTGFREKALDFIEKQVHELRNAPIPVTGRHGDFGPWNMLTGSGGITVIDFLGFQEGPRPVDVLSMLVWLESLTHGVANSRRRVLTLRKSFLAGLGAMPEVPPPLVLLCEAHQRIIHIAGAIIARQGHIFERWQRSRWLKANIAWFLNPPDQSSLWPTQSSR
jgi:hypothetical protein